MRPRVLVTHWVQPEVVAFLEEFSVVDRPTTEGDVFTREEIRSRGRTADALLVCMADMVDGALLDDCPRVRVVAAAVKGSNTIDVEDCSRRNIWVTTCPDLLTAGTAELAVTLMLALGRRLNEAQRLLREDFQGWRPRLLAPGLAGATAGLLGMGRLGRAVARRLQGFDMALVYHDLHPPPPEDEDALGVVACGLDDLLAESDYVVVLVPLTDRTRGLLGATRIAAMKPGAFLVNCARGSVVDETAVAVALEEGRLGGYGADVFAMEDWRLPDRPRTIPEILLRQGDRVVLTPHIGSAVVETRRRIGLSAAGQIRAVFEGTRPSMAINDVQQREQG